MAQHEKMQIIYFVSKGQTDSYPRTQTLNIGFYSIKEIEFLGYAVFKDLIKIKKN